MKLHLYEVMRPYCTPGTVWVFASSPRNATLTVAEQYGYTDAEAKLVEPEENLIVAVDSEPPSLGRMYEWGRDNF